MRERINLVTKTLGGDLDSDSLNQQVDSQTDLLPLCTRSREGSRAFPGSSQPGKVNGQENGSEFYENFLWAYGSGFRKGYVLTR
jgi:hypothetical protein